MPIHSLTESEQAVLDGFATVVEAENYLKLSKAKIYQLMDSQELQYAKFGRSRRIPWRALRDYAQRHLIAP